MRLDFGREGWSVRFESNLADYSPWKFGIAEELANLPAAVTEFSQKPAILVAKSRCCSDSCCSNRSYLRLIPAR